jgi:predicted AAA+ superfamily ATPase
LTAIGEPQLLVAKRNATFIKPLPAPIHQKLLNHLKRFLILGGMPEVIASFVQNGNINSCGQVLDDLITSLKTDFAKYKQQVPFLRISEVFDSVVRQAGGKFVYTKAAAETSHRQIKEAVELLIMAGLVIQVTHTAANGPPLGAEANPKHQKMLLLDTGIFQRLLGLNIAEILFEDNFDVINKSAIAEQFVGLEILKSSSCYCRESLYFWHREAKSSRAEVDYVVQQHENIVPIEVKSGKKGSMQSLFLF